MKSKIVVLLLVVLICPSCTKQEEVNETKNLSIEIGNDDLVEVNNQHVDNAEMINEIIIIADVLNVRDSSNIESNIITKVYKNNIYSVLDSNLDNEERIWYKIKTSDGLGWVAGWYCNEIDINQCVGVYKYLYEHNTENLIEDHYIVLELNDNTLIGRYYGTSDDFDDVREGYYPGFFVLDMKYLSIKNHTISFTLELKEDETFTNPVDLIYKSSEEVPVDINPIWVNSHITGRRNYTGTISNGVIKLDTKYEIRELKIDSEKRGR